MIITKPKDPNGLLAKLEGFQEVALVGCGLCATVCQTGGKNQVSAMADFLSSHGKKISWTEVIDGVCQKLLTSRSLTGHPKPEAVLVLACGSGAQTVAGITNAPVYPALDSLFLGSVIRAGRFEEKCSLCGDCVVDEFSGLCPVTLCPKSLLNGPCGGMVDGKCEADTERECVWYRIYLLKEAAGRLQDLVKITPPRPRRRGAKY